MRADAVPWVGDPERAARRIRGSAHVSSQEWRWVITAAAVVMALTCVPYVLALDGLLQGQVFGVLPLSVEDGYSYLAKMQQGARGAWSFTLPYSSEPHDGVFLFLFYLMLGKVAGTDHLAQALVFHAVRLAFGFTSLVALYRLTAEYVASVALRRLSVFVYALAGGLGWLALGFIDDANSLAALPLELYSPEAFALISLLGWPHLLASRTLVIVALIFIVTDRPGWAGLALLITAVIVPLSVIPVCGVAVVWCVLQRVSVAERRVALWRTSLVVLLPAPMVLYGVWALEAHPVMAAMHAQLLLPSPNVHFYLLGYAPWWGLAALGFRAVARRRPLLARTVAVWAVLGVILVYLPINTQRRLIEGYWPLLVPLAVAGLPALASWVRQRSLALRRWLVPALAGWTLPASALVIASVFGVVLTPGAPAFVPAAQVGQFALVSQARGVALGETLTLTWAPAFTGLTGYAGHPVETLDPERKDADIARFYAATTTDAARIQFLRENGIAFVFSGPREHALGGFDPAGADYLVPVGSGAGAYAVYRVQVLAP
jgi:hypothetical protein